MNAISKISDTDRYARCIQSSKRVRWDIDEDVIRGRHFDVADKFLPDGLSLTDAFTTLSNDEKRFVSQILRVLTACRKVTAGESEQRLTERRCCGSLAQCDLIHLTFTEAALRARKDHLARALITERVARKPASQLNRLLRQRLQTIVPGQPPRQLGCLSSPDHGNLKDQSSATQSLLTAA